PGVGTDDVDVAAATELGIPVVIAPGANTISVAEHALALIFALAKDLPRNDQAMREGNFAYRNSYRAMELKDKTLGLVGGGAIGGALAKLAGLIGMKVKVYDPYLKPERAKELGMEQVSLDELLTTSDAISLHSPLTPETKNMIGEKELRSMKPTAMLVNCARGGLIDEDALYRVMKEGHLLGMATDVFAHEPVPTDHPLFSLPNFISTPHMAGLTSEAAIGVATMAASGVLGVLNNGTWPHLKNPDALKHPRWQK
ncbi:MAG: hydroxyacid dehydrogenase, partial [Coriobacteriia bacterium]|nr:hydroxyacid dehydrogenase [Coriobacteriia bacterium]